MLCLVCAFIADSVVGEPIGMTDGPLLGFFLILPFALLANVCYTGGWFFEIVVRAVRGPEKAAAFGVKAFRAGIVFSICVTLLPAFLSWTAFLIAFFHGQKHGPVGE